MYGYLRFTFEYFMKKFLFIKQSEKFHKLFCVLKKMSFVNPNKLKQFKFDIDSAFNYKMLR